MPPKRDLKDEAISMLREKVKKLEAEVLLREGQLRSTETALQREATRRSAAEDVASTYYEAIGVLAAVVPNTTRPEREARERARRYLESKKIRPPATLGSSRPGARAKKRVRKKSEEQPPTVDLSRLVAPKELTEP